MSPAHRDGSRRAACSSRLRRPARWRVGPRSGECGAVGPRSHRLVDFPVVNPMRLRRALEFVRDSGAGYPGGGPGRGKQETGGHLSSRPPIGRSDARALLGKAGESWALLGARLVRTRGAHSRSAARLPCARGDAPRLASRDCGPPAEGGACRGGAGEAMRGGAQRLRKGRRLRESRGGIGRAWTRPVSREHGRGPDQRPGPGRVARAVLRQLWSGTWRRLGRRTDARTVMQHTGGAVRTGAPTGRPAPPRPHPLSTRLCAGGAAPGRAQEERQGAGAVPSGPGSAALPGGPGARLRPPGQQSSPSAGRHLSQPRPGSKQAAP
jgi:hypothetical protein